MESRSKFFPTKSGQCHIYPDRIELISSSGLDRMLAKRGVQRMVVIYFILLIVFGIAIGISLWINNYFLVAFFAIAWMFSLVSMWTNRNVSAATYIDRKHIERIDYEEAVPGQSRASFTVYFRPKKQLLRRKILLPSILHNGHMVAQSAYYMFKDEGLLDKT